MFFALLACRAGEQTFLKSLPFFLLGVRLQWTHVGSVYRAHR